MTPQVIRQLNQLNKQFYATVAQDFSETRQQAWEGWEKLIPSIEEQLKMKGEIGILDVGCGNARFAEFLQLKFPHGKVHYSGIDSSEALLNEAKKRAPHSEHFSLEFAQQDLVEKLLQDGTLKLHLSMQEFDVIVAFGVLHHIPSQELRERFIQELTKKLTKDGILIFTAWEFDRLPNLIKRQTTAEAIDLHKEDLEANDFLLTWERGASAVRYCHLTTDEEARHLVRKAHLEVKESFLADGKQQTNRYVVCSPTLRP